MNIRFYIDFSIKYNTLVGNKLNYDLKCYIWDIYKKMIAQEILTKFIKKYTMSCFDCYKINWFYSFKTKRHNFYRVKCCNNEDVCYTDVSCCEKYICLTKCRFKINCKKCQKKIVYIPENMPDDIGWNHIENKKNLIIECPNCNYVINHKLLWNYSGHNFTSIGNLYNKY